MGRINLGSLFVDRNLENLLSRVDTVIGALDKKTVQFTSEKDLTSQALKEFSNTLDNENTESKDSTIEQLLQKITIPAQRVARYHIYDELYRTVQLIKRIVKCYIDYTLQKDTITGNIIVYTESGEKKADSSKINIYKNFEENVTKHFQLEEHLKHKILPHLLRYGDTFIEIIDLKNDIGNLPAPTLKKDTLSPGSNNDVKPITEDLEYIKTKLNYYSSNPSIKTDVEKDCINTLVNSIFEFGEGDVFETEMLQENYDYIEEFVDNKNQQKSKNIDSFEEKQLNQFILRYHDPKNIAILQTSYNNTVIGYVEVKENQQVEVYPGIGMQFASVIKQISALSKNKGDDHNVIVRKIVYRVIQKIAENAKVFKIPSPGKTPTAINKDFENMLQAKLGDELFYLIKKLYFEADPDRDRISKVFIRFISNERMVHICYNPIDYSPYGTSIIDALVYPGKLYLLSQLSNMVSKLSRASLIRKWILEQGPREQGTNLIQKLTRQLRNQRITVDDIVSFKSIPKILSDYKDLILLSKKGQRYVDVEIQSMGDPNIKTQDLEDSRKELIAISGCPAPYLGYNDVVDLREQLVSINVNFATEIITIQNLINCGASQLNDKLALLLGYKEQPSSYIKPSLKPPVVLVLQLLESIISSLGNIQASFAGAGVPYNPYYLMRKFVTNLNWDEFEEEAKEYILKKKALESATTPPEGGMY